MQYIKIAIVFIVFLTCSDQLQAQNWDVSITKDLNPQHPNSAVWKGFSSSAYPLSIAAPISMIVAGKINNDKTTFHNGVELLVGVGGAVVATEAIKVIVNRERPYQKYRAFIHTK